MSDVIQYDTYTFSDPQPSVAIERTPVFFQGKIDYIDVKVSVVGMLTGNFSDLKEKRKSLVSGLSNGFKTLSIGDSTFDAAQPTNIGFSESNLSSFLPYSIEFQSFEEKEFSEFFGVRDVVNSWSYAEQEDRTVQASHRMSAVGVKIDNNSKLTNAKNFVTNIDNNFQNYSSFFNGENAVFRSYAEEIDELQGSYSLTKTYILSDSRQPVSNDHIVKTQIQINYSKDNALQVTVNGSIMGDLDGSAVTTGLFPPSLAESMAIDFIGKSKADDESELYDVDIKLISYNYNQNETSNTINFSFTFGQREVDNFTVNIQASKDSNMITASINGEIRNDSCLPLYDDITPLENSTRFLSLPAITDGLGRCLEFYGQFYNVGDKYDGDYFLNPQSIQTSVGKNPIEQKISYAFAYNNQRETDFYKLDATAKINKPIINLKSNRVGLQGISSEILFVRTLGDIAVNASAIETDSELTNLKGFILEKIEEINPCYKITSRSDNVDVESIGAEIQVIYDNE
jgi:hypothetical protein